VLEKVTLADVTEDEIPESVHRLTEDPDAWKTH
jgi:hypothetical protein